MAYSIRLVAAGLIVAGCGTARTPELSQPGSHVASQLQHSRDVIAADEIAGKQVRTAYDVIVQLRPEFLKPARRVARAGLRTRQAMDELFDEQDGRFPFVFLNGQPQGGPAILRTISAASIVDIRRYREGHVPTAYGIGHAAGVIDVRTKSGRN